MGRMPNMPYKQPQTNRRRLLGSVFVLGLVMALTAPLIITGSDPEPGMFIQLIPLSDGHEVWLQVEVVGGADAPQSGQVCDNISGHCQSMTCVNLSCHSLLTGWPPQTTVEGQMAISLTLASGRKLNCESIPFVRAFIAAGSAGVK